MKISMSETSSEHGSMKSALNRKKRLEFVDRYLYSISISLHIHVYIYN